MGEQILPELCDHQLRGRCEEINLYEVEHALNREENQQPERDFIEQSRVRRDECRVEQVTHDLGERQGYTGARQQTNERHGESPKVRTYSRKQLSERARR